MGYSVLLWSVPEFNLSDGDVVPVYIKSNISKTYVIGTNTPGERIEVPLWQITEPLSKKKNQSQERRFSEFQHIYAKVVLDGLPIREEAVNTAKQVYRLRKDQTIKVLYRGNGASVMSGDNALKGEWLRVLTADGTIGWCFSYNLRLFDETQSNTNVSMEATPEVDELLEKVLETKWYPESYLTMVRRKRIDLETMTAASAIDFGKESGKVYYVSANGPVSFDFEGIEKSSEKNYKFKNSSLTMIVNSESQITLQYPNEKGMIFSTILVTLDESVENLLEQGKIRRAEQYEILRELATSFESSNYGTLVFGENNQFSWTGYNLLTPTVIPRNAGTTGTVAFELFLDSSLAIQYEGAITFTFTNSGEKVIFLYTIEDGGIRLEDATKATITNKLIKSRSQSPVIMFFSANNSVGKQTSTANFDF